MIAAVVQEVIKSKPILTPDSILSNSNTPPEQAPILLLSQDIAQDAPSDDSEVSAPSVPHQVEREGGFDSNTPTPTPTPQKSSTCHYDDSSPAARVEQEQRGRLSEYGGSPPSVSPSSSSLIDYEEDFLLQILLRIVSHPSYHYRRTSLTTHNIENICGPCQKRARSEAHCTWAATDSLGTPHPPSVDYTDYIRRLEDRISALESGTGRGHHIQPSNSRSINSASEVSIPRTTSRHGVASSTSPDPSIRQISASWAGSSFISTPEMSVDIRPSSSLSQDCLHHSRSFQKARMLHSTLPIIPFMTLLVRTPSAMP